MSLLVLAGIYLDHCKAVPSFLLVINGNMILPTVPSLEINERGCGQSIRNETWELPTLPSYPNS